MTNQATVKVGQDRWWPWVLVVLAGVTRLPLAGRSLGEPDSGRYVIGLLQWMRHGPDAQFIYSKTISPGYYAAAAWVMGHSRISAAALLVGLSVVAAVLTAPLLYWIGRQFCRAEVAAAGAVLFLLAPGMWWLGLEPHPEGVGVLLVLAAMAAWMKSLRARRWVWGWVLGAFGCFTLALLVKADLILLGAIFAALAWKAKGWRAAVSGVALAVGALGAFFELRPALAQMSAWAAQTQTHNTLRAFLVFPHGAEAIKQLIPLVSYGLGTLALLGAVVGIAMWRREPEIESWRGRWGWAVAAWVLPSAGFWLLISGGINARHLAPLLLLPLWAALEGVTLRTKQGWVLAAVVVAVLGANVLLIPASSNITLFPSGNVVASARDLALRQRGLDAWMKRKLSVSSRVCFVGNPTLPYLELARLRQRPEGYLRLGTDGPVMGKVDWKVVDSSRQYPAVATACRQSGRAVDSLEYNAAGLHERFFGEEWRWLPLARRWYPGGAVRLTAVLH